MGGNKGGTAIVSPDEFEKVVEKIRDSFESIAHKVDEADEAFDKAIKYLSRGGWLLGLVGGGAGAAIADHLRDKQRQAQGGFDELLAKIKEIIEGSLAPLLYIKDSSSWLSVSGKVREARNADLSGGDLGGYWEGTAADRYENARTKQGAAMEAAEGVCSQTSDFLATVGQAGLTAYINIYQALAEATIDFGAAISEIATIVEAPWGAQDLINAIGSVIKAVVKIFIEFTNLAATEILASDKLKNSIDNPYGFPGDKWPKAVTSEFSDATTADGDGSAWTPAE